MKYCKIISLAVVLILCVPSCASTETPIVPAITATPTPMLPAATRHPLERTDVAPKRGGTLTLTVRAPQTLNPLLNEDVTVDAALRLVFEPLCVLDDSFKPSPNKKIVQSVTFENGFLTANIAIADGAAFSDGSPVRADDVVFSLNYAKNAPETALYATSARKILSAAAVGTNAIIVKFYKNLPENMYCLDIPIVPKNYYTSQNSRDFEPIGSGVYKFINYKSMETLTFSATSDTVPPYIDKIEFIVTDSRASDEACFSAALSDTLADVAAETGNRRGIRESAYESTIFDFIGFNFSSTTFTNVETRRALAKIIPFGTLTESVYAGYAVESLTPISPNSWLFDKNIELPTFYAQEAAEILSGRNLKILVNSDAEQHVKIAEILSENLVSIGAKPEIIAVSPTEYEASLAEGGHDIFIAAAYLSYFPDFSFLLHSETIIEPTPSPNPSASPSPSPSPEPLEFVPSEQPRIFTRNPLNYADKRADRLLEALLASANEERFVENARKIQNFIAEELPFIGIAFRQSSLYVSERIHGELNPSASNPLRNVENWSIE